MGRISSPWIQRFRDLFLPGLILYSLKFRKREMAEGGEARIEQDPTRVEVLRDEGKGRATIFLIEKSGGYERFLGTAWQAVGRVLYLSTPEVTGSNWEQLSESFDSLLNLLGVRQATFVAFGAASILIQSLALTHLKGVRSIILVNGASRAHPGIGLRIADKIERSLPLGLPLRMRSSAFDSKPFLHRIRCPVLIVTTMTATPYEISQAEILNRGLPTAWRMTLDSGREEDHLRELIESFQEVQAKCPQKVR
jgi:hypothetical protein